MSPGGRPARAAASVALLAVLGPACGAMRGARDLSELDVELDRIATVRLAGIPVAPGRAAPRHQPAGVTGTLPLTIEVLLRIANRGRRPVDLRRLRWELRLDGRRLVRGTVDERRTIAPAATVLVPVTAALDVADLLARHAGVLAPLALALAGGGPSPADVALRVVPILDTPLGGVPLPAITIPLERAGR